MRNRPAPFDCIKKTLRNGVPPVIEYFLPRYLVKARIDFYRRKPAGVELEVPLFRDFLG